MTDDPGDKFRLRFRKDGPLRFLSHLDLTRCVERILRRADLPFKTTQGFHPTPRMVFALSLSLGAAGYQEVLELELTSPHHPNDVLDRLNRQAPGGLTFHSARIIPMKTTARPRRAEYLIPIPSELHDATAARIDQILSQPQVWVTRMKPKPRKLNIRPYLRGMNLTPAQGESHLTLDLWVTDTGTARADEILRLLDLSELLDTGVLIARTFLELHDEVPPNPPDQPPEGPPETAPWELKLPHPNTPVGDPGTSATWGLSPNGPVVE
jgi:radical SAM-linked protein